MTVQELIDALMEVEDKSKEVLIYYTEEPILDAIENEDNVTLYDY